jgi:hypothetical protein
LLGCQLAMSETWIGYDSAEHKFYLPATSLDMEPELGSEGITGTATLKADGDIDIDDMPVGP